MLFLYAFALRPDAVLSNLFLAIMPWLHLIYWYQCRIFVLVCSCFASWNSPWLKANSLFFRKLEFVLASHHRSSKASPNLWLLGCLGSTGAEFHLKILPQYSKHHLLNIYWFIRSITPANECLNCVKLSLVFAQRVDSKCWGPKSAGELLTPVAVFCLEILKRFDREFLQPLVDLQSSLHAAMAAFSKLHRGVQPEGWQKLEATVKQFDRYSQHWSQNFLASWVFMHSHTEQFGCSYESYQCFLLYFCGKPLSRKLRGQVLDCHLGVLLALPVSGGPSCLGFLDLSIAFQEFFVDKQPLKTMFCIISPTVDYLKIDAMPNRLKQSQNPSFPLWGTPTSHLPAVRVSRWNEMHVW